MKKIFGLMPMVALMAVSLTAGVAEAAPKAGSCESAAKKLEIGGAGFFSLTQEYDPDWGEYYENYVYYYKVTLKRGDSYSVWLDNASSDTMSVDVYAKWGDDEPWAGFYPTSYRQGGKDHELLVMPADEWDLEEDPASWTYYILVSGDEGDSGTLRIAMGSSLPSGIADNPKSISISDKEQSATGKLYGDEYYMTARLVAGVRYAFGVVANGAVTNDFIISGSGKELPYPAWTGRSEDKCSRAVTFVPDETGACDIAIVSVSEGEDNPFELRYMKFGSRDIDEHEASEIEVGGEQIFAPGHMNAPSTGKYDDIIDEKLFRFKAEKGKSYVAYSEGAATNLVMKVYDAKGNTLYTNRGIDSSDRNVLVGFTATTAGNYYIGVCEDIDDDTEEPSGKTITLKLAEVENGEEEPTAISAKPATADDNPVEIDPEGSDEFTLDRLHWSKTFVIGGRKDIAYVFKCDYAGAAKTSRRLKAEVFTLSGTRETAVSTSGSIDPLDDKFLTVKRTANGPFYLRLSVKDGAGLDYPPTKVHAMAYSTKSGVTGLGMVKVELKGAPEATWYLANESSMKYPSGTSVLVPAGVSQKVTFAKVNGFSVLPTMATVVAEAGKETLVSAVYNDKYDPKDDQISGKIDSVTCAPTSWSLKATETTQTRTLWATDPRDWFKFTASDGYYYDFRFAEREGDAVISVYDADQQPVAGMVDRERIDKLGLTKGTYYLKVAHRDAAAPEDGSYVIAGNYANVGAVKLDKAKYSVKENAASLTVKVKRTAKNGRVKVHFRTIEGEYAFAADHDRDDHPEYRKYYPVDEDLVWEDGDNKDKTIVIRLIPDIVAYYHDTPRTFSVELTDAGGDYPAVFAAGLDKATVTLTESQSSKAKDTIASAYKPIAAKKASKPEGTPLRCGTYFGVVRSESGLTNNVPAAGSIALTTKMSAMTNSKTKEVTTNDTLSASVKIAGKSYTFKTDTKNPAVWEDAGETKRITLKLEQKVNRIAYTNELELTVRDGLSDDDWLEAACSAKLTMNVPDSNSKGVQEDIVYCGELYRDNSKIQEYLNVATNFVGYYTVALEPWQGGEPVVAGDIPAGNGYALVTVDNGGKAKVVFKMGDGSTGMTVSSIAASIGRDKDSSTGYALKVPVYGASSKYCVAGVLKLVATEATNGDGRKTVVIDSEDSELAWHTDDLALSVNGDHAFILNLLPVGGFYDTVERLQRHYYDRDFETFKIDTVGVDELPEAMFTINKVKYDTRVAVQQADGFEVGLAGDKAELSAKKLVKGDDKLYDFEASSNPANIKVSIARATGLVTGSFSVWAEGVDSAGKKVQKEITGPKHSGVLLMSRDEVVDGSGLGANVISAGSMMQSVTVPVGDTDKTRKWTYSAPFNIEGVEIR